MNIMKKIVNSTTITVIAMLVLTIILLVVASCNNRPFDYQRIDIIGGDVIITILNDDIDRPLAAYYFAEQQGKKHNAYFLGVSQSTSVRLKSWGWSWGKQHQREEYTYNYKFYYKKRRVKK